MWKSTSNDKLALKYLNTSSKIERCDVCDIPDEEGHRLAALEESQGVMHDDGARVDDRKLVERDQNLLRLILFVWERCKWCHGYISWTKMKPEGSFGHWKLLVSGVLCSNSRNKMIKVSLNTHFLLLVILDDLFKTGLLYTCISVLLFLLSLAIMVRGHSNCTWNFLA